jgi:Fe-S-cluster-containing dehydrogenase component
MNILRKERGQYPLIDVAYRPTPCMHCDNPPCADAAKNDAVIQRPDGIVLIDPERSRGQKDLAKSCPYGAIWWNEELELPQKCTLCAHLLDDGWSQPRCAQACPTGALQMVRRTSDEMASMVEKRSLKVLRPELRTQPRVYYDHLNRFDCCFISGSVATETGGVIDCVEHAQVRLEKDGHTVSTARTDAFGDFKFDDLKENSGIYEVCVTGDNGKTVKAEVSVATSVSMDTIMI